VAAVRVPLPEAANAIKVEQGFNSREGTAFHFKRIKILNALRLKINRAPVALACNPSYSGGRDQEDPSSKPARGISAQDPNSKIPSQKSAGGVALSSNPSTEEKIDNSFSISTS
jgi:hypothetical protein